MSQIPHQTPAPECEPRRRLLIQGAAVALLGGVAAGLSACGGGGDAADPATAGAADAGPADRKRQLGGVDSGGTGSEFFLSAAFSRVAPLTAAGVSFDTAVASITDADGRLLAADELAAGMTGRIDAWTPGGPGGTTSAQARSIEVGEQVLGPVTTVDPAAQGVRVLGLWVAITPRTVFDAGLPVGLAGVRAGALLRVWGEFDPVAGQVFATRVAEVAAADAFVLRGVLTQLDRAAGRARIGSWDVVFDAGDTALVGTGLDIGLVVRARLATAEAGARLLALREDALRLPDRVEAQIHGRVTRIDTPLRFAVDGVDVDISGASEVQGRAALALGARAEVQGRSIGGRLLADSVALEAEEPVALTGRISAVRLADRSFVLRGITVSWSLATRFEGGPARLLTPNRRVEVLGRWSADRQRLVASRIHVEA